MVNQLNDSPLIGGNMDSNYDGVGKKIHDKLKDG